MGAIVGVTKRTSTTGVQVGFGDGVHVGTGVHVGATVGAGAGVGLHAATVASASTVATVASAAALAMDIEIDVCTGYCYVTLGMLRLASPQCQGMPRWERVTSVAGAASRRHDAMATACYLPLAMGRGGIRFGDVG